jgi:hypothetical protein
MLFLFMAAVQPGHARDEYSPGIGAVAGAVTGRTPRSSGSASPPSLPGGQEARVGTFDRSHPACRRCPTSMYGIAELMAAPAVSSRPPISRAGRPPAPHPRMYDRDLTVMHLRLHTVALTCIPWWPAPRPVSSAWRIGSLSSLRISGRQGCNRGCTLPGGRTPPTVTARTPARGGRARHQPRRRRPPVVSFMVSSPWLAEAGAVAGRVRGRGSCSSRASSRLDKWLRVHGSQGPGWRRRAHHAAGGGRVPRWRETPEGGAR